MEQQFKTISNVCSTIKARYDAFLTVIENLKRLPGVDAREQ